jgi:acetamidase/formamidase
MSGVDRQEFHAMTTSALYSISENDRGRHRDDAEVCGVAAEIPTRGVLSVDLIKGRTIGTPRVESEDYIMTVGSARPMEDAARIAFYELVMWLESDYGMERLLAYQLCSQIARVRLANMVDILYSVVAKYPKSHLPA